MSPTVTRFAAALAGGGPPIVGVVNGRAVRAVMGADDNGSQQAQAAAGQPGGQQPPERPEGVSEAEWSALGDPGKAAIVRERQRAAAAEQALAAFRQQQTGGQQSQTGGQASAAGRQTGGQPDPEDAKSNGQPDVASLVQTAVAAALQPLLERDQQREVAAATQRLRDGVLTAARDRLVDPTDALTNLDLPTLTDGAGGLDGAKLTAALDGLVQRKPHLAKVVDDRRLPGTGSVHGGAPGQSVPFDQQVQSALSLMAQQTGMRSAATP